jgi:GT2 family glycosyltransferase
MKKNINTCIIILNWNGLSDTKKCLNSLLKIQEKDYKILVIDNGSKGNDVAVLEKMYGNNIDLCPLQENTGFTGGVNFGLTYAQKKYHPEYYLLLNNDVIVTRNFLTELIKTASSNKKIGLVSPVIYNSANKKKLLYSGGKMQWLFARPTHQKKLLKETTQAGFVTGCSLLITKELFEKNGLLDNRFFAYFEDTAYCLSAIRAGYICVVEPRSIIYHKESATLGKTSKMFTYFFSRNRILFVNNYTSFFYRIYFSLFNFFKLIAVQIYFIVTRQTHRMYPFLKGYIDGNLKKGGKPTL